MKIKLITIFVVAISLMLLSGCTDRGVNTYNTYSIDEGGITIPTGAAAFQTYFPLQLNNSFAQIPIAAYQPREAFPQSSGGTLKPNPVLILFAPQDGDEYFYFDHGLAELADEMISSGEIEPMSIVCVGNDPVIGGYFYAGSSPAAGFYDDFISERLLDFIYNEFLFAPIDTSMMKPAVGGVGMGAYGAVRAAILNPDLFSAISFTDGPMDFDGANGSGGFIPFFDDALNEQGLLNDTDWLDEYDTSGGWHYSRLFMGGAYAFSPKVLDCDYTITIEPNDNTIEEGDFYAVVTVNSIDTIDVGDNNITLVEEFYKNSTDVNHSKFDFHLPFTNDGAVHTPIWDFWTDQNLPTLLSANSGALNNKSIWIGHTTEIDYANYSNQTASFMSSLSSAGYSYTTFNYSSRDGLPVSRNEYVYDLMREMLKFHSAKFNQ